MTISIAGTRPTHGDDHDDDLLRRAVHPSSTADDRFLILEGAVGTGKSHALAGIEAAARADGHKVVRLRSSGGDPVVSASSFGPWVALVRGAAERIPSPVAGTPDGTGRAVGSGRHVVLVDDFHTLAEGARTELHSMLAGLVRDPGTVCVVAVDDRETVPGWDGLRSVPLRPLGAAAIEDLLRRDSVDLPATRLAMLRRLAAGNPLLLRTVGRAWTAESRTDRSAPFPVAYPPLGAAAERAARVVDGLSGEEREAALLASIASVEFPPDAELELSAPDGTSTTVGLRASFAGAGPVVRDPVVRASLLSTASGAELRRARAAVAATAGVPERLRVLAMASVSPGADDRQADRLVALVEDSFRLRRPDEAVTALFEAARLTSSDDRRSRLRARATAVAAFIGDFAVVDTEGDRLAGTGAEQLPAMTAAIEFVRAVRSGEVRDCRRAVLAALDMEDHDDDLLVTTLFVLCFLRGDHSWWDDALSLAADRDLDPVLRLVEDCVDDSRSEHERAALYRDARASAADAQPWKAVALHVAWSLLDATDPRRDLVDAMLGRSGGTGLLGYFRSCRDAVAAFQAGRLRAASAVLTRLHETADRWGASTFVALADALHAVVHSVQGDAEQAVEKAEDATRWARQHGAPLVARTADHARTSLDVAMGRFEEAHARSVTRPPVESRWVADGYGPVELLDAAECAARLRLHDHGIALLETAEQRIGSRVSPRQALVLRAARAVLDVGNDVRAAFEEALATVDVDTAPYEVARVRFAYGDWLRRNMHPLDARTQFRLAASVFEGLGAEQWRRRAQSELRVAGGACAPTVSIESADLSEQERRVASLAAAGLTNKQIANQLFLSPRTVSGHLYRLFPKLGVTTRAGLRDALLGLERAG